MIRVLAVALLVLASTPAHAASPRWGSLDLSAGKYRPDIDAEFGGAAGPYAASFGTSRGWMFQLGLSKALYTKIGSVEVGLRSGYFEDNGRGLISDGGTPPVLTPSGDDTTLKIIPTSVAMTYRFDWLADRYRWFPLAPYGRAAFERYNWWVTDGGGDTAERGATMGWSVTGGIGLMLDFFDPVLARELDNDSGVNHTYLFFEVTKSTIDDFGSSSSWNLSSKDLSYAGGLLFVF